jgi:hypothetical protein
MERASEALAPVKGSANSFNTQSVNALDDDEMRGIVSIVVEALLFLHRGQIYATVEAIGCAVRTCREE